MVYLVKDGVFESYLRILVNYTIKKCFLKEDYGYWFLDFFCISDFFFKDILKLNFGE